MEGSAYWRFPNLKAIAKAVPNLDTGFRLCYHLSARMMPHKRKTEYSETPGIHPRVSTIEVPKWRKWQTR